MTTVLIVPGSVVVLALTFYALHRVTDSYFVQSLEILSTRLRMTSDVAGASLMAMGSSAPELFTSLLALIKGMELADLGAGTIVGSAIFNILVIVGASAVVAPSVLTWQPAVRDMVFYIGTIVLLYAVFLDGTITLAEASWFVLAYVGYLVLLPLWRRLLPYEDQAGLAQADVTLVVERSRDRPLWYWWWAVPIDRAFALVLPDLERNPRRYLLVFLLSIAAIAGLSWLLVEAGVLLAATLGVPRAIIGLTVLAVGTSVPDLFSSLIVARRGKGDMAVSNAVGSNIFDILVGLGVVWMVVILVRGESIPVAQENLHSSVALLLASVAALLFLLVVRRWWLGRFAGYSLVGLYALFLLGTITGWL